MRHDSFEATGERIENLRALVCPHAGYQFSGQTAAFASDTNDGIVYSAIVGLSAYGTNASSALPALRGFSPTGPAGNFEAVNLFEREQALKLLSGEEPLPDDVGD